MICIKLPVSWKAGQLTDYMSAHFLKTDGRDEVVDSCSLEEDEALVS